jgi:Sigma-70, region 4
MSTRASRAERAGAVSGNGNLKPPKKNASAKAWNRYLRRLVRVLGECVSSLTPQAQQILTWRTGHGPGRGESEKQVARRLGVTLSRERRLESRAAQALRLASAAGRCGQSPVQVSVSSALLSGAPPEVLQDLASGTDGSPAAETGISSPASGHLSQPKAAGSGGSKSGTTPAITIQKSSLPSLPTAGSGFPWLLVLLAALATGALMLGASRRSLVLAYVETSRQRRRAGSAHRGTEVGAGSADTAGDAASDGTAAEAAVAGAASAASEAAGPLESLAGWVAAGEATRAASPIDRGQELESQGDLAAAMAVYSRADADGDARGACRVGRLLESRGDMAGAIAAYSRADERGDPKGSISLGILLAERGSVTGALDAFERADRRGNASGAFNRAVLLEEQGDIHGAVAALRRAYERGDAEMTQRAREALSQLGVQVD